jgi:hypothetical protein
MAPAALTSLDVLLENPTARNTAFLVPLGL